MLVIPPPPPHHHLQLQYQAMGLCDSYEEDIPHEAITSEEEAIKLFDDPTYVLGDNTRKVGIYVAYIRTTETYSGDHKRGNPL